MGRGLLLAQRLSSLLSNIKISYARQYTAAAAEAMRSSGIAAREFTEASKAAGGGGNNKRTAFWMRDPATGDWIPEDHFGETDIAELRPTAGFFFPTLERRVSSWRGDPLGLASFGFAVAAAVALVSMDAVRGEACSAAIWRLRGL